MFRPFARILLLFVAVLGLCPGVNRALEQFVERVEHGHAAHALPGETDPLGAEHGCSPIEHHCPCHDGPSMADGPGVSSGPAFGEWLTAMLDRQTRLRYADRRAFLRGHDGLITSRAAAPPTPPPNG